MKKLLNPSYLTLLLVSAVLMVGCATTTTHVAMDRVPTKDTTFIIVTKYDPIDVGLVISEEISKRGYKVQLHSPYGKASGQPSKPVAAFASGFFISENGVLITNSHVVKEASSILVRKDDGENFMARTMIADDKNDIAILEPIEPMTVPKWFSLVSFRETKIGDPLWIIGFPLLDVLGKHPRVTDGIISADVGLMDDPTRFQVSASIQPGNSGGPILNEEFHVTGVATEKLSDLYAIRRTGQIPQNVNFGVKADYVKLLFNENIEKEVSTETSDVNSLEDAIKATALIAVNVHEIPESVTTVGQTKRILVVYRYQYIWDLFHYTLKTFNIQWIDGETGELVADGNFAGGSLQGYAGIVKKVLKEVFDKAGIK